MFNVEMLDAYEGDALWVTYGEQDDAHHMLIDAGRKRTYVEIAKRINKLSRPLELFVMTHIDDDHVYGAVPLFADQRHAPAECFKDVWYNCYTHINPSIASRPPRDVLGPKNGEIFAALILKGGYPWNEAFGGATVVVADQGELPVKRLAGGMTLTLLSPTWTELEALKTFWEKNLDDIRPGDAEAAFEAFKKRRDLRPYAVLGSMLDVVGLLDKKYKSDTKAPNGSSIAFLAEYDGHSVLFTGDAHPPVLERSIQRLLDERGDKRLRVDALKVSHHGSKNNTSTKLLELLDCRRYLISTDGSRSHKHPDGESIARIVDRNREASEKSKLYFNHRSDQTKVWGDDIDACSEWNYVTFYPPKGRIVDLEDDA